MSLSIGQKKKSKLSLKARHSMMSMVLVLVFTASGFGLFRICSNRQAQFENKLAELDEVNNQVRVLETHNDRLRDRVALLKTTSGIEEVAREKLGLVRPGELAYAVVPPPPQQFVAADDLSLKYGEQEVKEVDKDRGTIIRILRHLFGTKKLPEQVSS